MIYVILSIIGIMLLCVLLMSIRVGNKEHFHWEPKWKGLISNDCYTEKPGNCLNYSNCGMCLSDNKPQCRPGDEQGPFFKEHCSGWMYSNYYDRKIFGEKVTSITPSFGQVYPDYEYWNTPLGRVGVDG
jgi:hypothetical protein